MKDTTITAKVKAALHHEKEVSSDNIQAGTIAGVVSLKGTVPTKHRVARAEEIAQETMSVRGVNNKLTVMNSESIAE